MRGFILTVLALCMLLLATPAYPATYTDAKPDKTESASAGFDYIKDNFTWTHEHTCGNGSSVTGTFAYKDANGWLMSGCDDSDANDSFVMGPLMTITDTANIGTGTSDVQLVEGIISWNTTNKEIEVYNGSAWKRVQNYIRTSSDCTAETAVAAGELCFDTGAVTETIFVATGAGTTFRRNSTFAQSYATECPTAKETGEICFDEDDSFLRVWDGASWINTGNVATAGVTRVRLTGENWLADDITFVTTGDITSTQDDATRTITFGHMDGAGTYTETDVLSVNPGNTNSPTSSWVGSDDFGGTWVMAYGATNVEVVQWESVVPANCDTSASIDFIVNYAIPSAESTSAVFELKWVSVTPATVGEIINGTTVNTDSNTIALTGKTAYLNYEETFSVTTGTYAVGDKLQLTLSRDPTNVSDDATIDVYVTNIRRKYTND